jgi:hypothetical protein
VKVTTIIGGRLAPAERIWTRPPAWPPHRRAVIVYRPIYRPSYRPAYVPPARPLPDCGCDDRRRASDDADDQSAIRSDSEAGYRWAQHKGLDEASRCPDYNPAFHRGCEAFVREQDR